MNTRFWLIRHAPTGANGAIGWTDLDADLSDEAQLERLAKLLPEDATMISSDLMRAQATADALQGARMRLPHNPALREFNFGDWEGQDFSDIARDDPKRSLAFWDNPGAVSPPNGESFNDVAARVSDALSELRLAHPGQDICCVAHYGVILAALALATGMPAKAVLKFRIDNLSVTCLEHHRPSGTWAVKYVNHRP